MLAAMRSCSLTLIVVAVTAADSSAQSPPTFNQDVARILYEKCVSCHRPGEVAPMSLVAYEDARPWVRAIRTRVAAREMPPWFADPRFGRPFINDPRLTDAEIQIVVAWVDGGAPRGSGGPPAPPSFVSGWRTFKNRPPEDRKSTRLNSSHGYISYAVFCLKKKKKQILSLLHLVQYERRKIRYM